MAKVIPLDRALKYGLLFVLSLVVFGGGASLSHHLIKSPSITLRWIGVAVAVASLLPWLALTVMGMGTLDEFQRHVVLVGTALAFIVECLFYTALYAMHDAKLIGAHTYFPHLLTAMVIWLLAVGLAALYYRIRP